jgi:hypothetical protein
MESNQEQTRRLAYQFWEAGGRRPDSQTEDWLRAEQQLRAMEQGANVTEHAAADATEPDASPTPDTPATRLAAQMFPRGCESK